MAGFFAMGGYAVYVWPAYAVSLIVLAGAAIGTFAADRRAKKRLAALEGPRA